MDLLRHKPVMATRPVAWESLGGWPGRHVARAIDTLSEWRGRHRNRRGLQAMDEHMRKDIGMSAADVWREARKPFWQE